MSYSIGTSPKNTHSKPHASLRRRQPHIPLPSQQKPNRNFFFIYLLALQSNLVCVKISVVFFLVNKVRKKWADL